MRRASVLLVNHLQRGKWQLAVAFPIAAWVSELLLFANKNVERKDLYNHIQFVLSLSVLTNSL